MKTNAEVRRALIVGAGFSGMTAALELNRVGIEVELLERNREWNSYGAGISLHGATLRVFKRLGIYRRFLECGAISDGVDVCDAHDDHLLVRLPTPSVGDGLPGGGAVMRPVLAGLLSDAVRAAGIPVRLGQSFSSMTQEEDGVQVVFEEGGRSTYDLVIGADGLHSAVRAQCFPDAPPARFMGQAVWRAVLPRPTQIERPVMWMQGTVKAGLNPVSRDEAYLFLTENRAHNDRVDPSSFQQTLKALLVPFASPILTEVRAQLGPHSQIVYRPLEQFLMPRPWYRGRVVLIGDAVHSTTPHLAAGACIGMEDAVVLAEEIVRAHTLKSALDAFQQRRWERSKMVVDNSERLGEIELTGGDPGEHATIMRDSMRELAQPI